MNPFNNKEIKVVYESFCIELEKEKEKKSIFILKRGEQKEFAFRNYNLNTNCHSIEQFAERLFFYGDKSKYFWNKRIHLEGIDFNINDVSPDFFRFIFHQFKQKIESSEKEGSIKYFNKEQNMDTVEFFKDDNNAVKFIHAISSITAGEKKTIKNYYLTLLHQLGDSTYKENSIFVSATKSESVAKKFSRGEIIINFWMLNFCIIDKNLMPKHKDIPLFIGKPYKNQKEISVLGVIFPHFIYSFTYNGELYINPAILKIENIRQSIFTGLDINQDDFIKRLNRETNFSKSMEQEGNKII